MEEQVATGAATELFQYGVLGIVVVVFALVIVFLWRWAVAQQEKLLTKIDELHTKRAEDQVKHQAVVAALEKERRADITASQDQFVDLVKSGNTVMLQVTTLLESLKDTVTESKNAMKEIVDDLRAARRSRP